MLNSHSSGFGDFEEEVTEFDCQMGHYGEDY